ncbi:MAG: dual specificity protein phosphatase family protein [Terriglobales bacterium]
MAMCRSAVPQPEAGNASGHAARAYGEKRRVSGISDFGEVTPRLFRGAQPNHAGFRALSKMGVSIVVDTRGNRSKSEGREVRRLGMRYVAIPWHCPFPHDEAFAKFLRLLRDNPDKKVFVHCRLGDDRTGMMIAAYRMADEDWTADEAMREMRKFGFSEAHHLICPTLASYEEHLPERLRTNPLFRGVR